MVTLSVQVQHAAWKPRARQLRAWVRQASSAALVAEKVKGGVSLAVLCADDAHLKTLNHDFRGRDKPTNVLAFPASGGEQGHLGDIALSLDMLSHEAQQQGKPVEAHLKHLVVHAVLHLLGYDHARSADAEAMERREVGILRSLGIPDPYL